MAAARHPHYVEVQGRWPLFTVQDDGQVELLVAGVVFPAHE